MPPSPASPQPVVFDERFLATPFATYARLRADSPVHRAITPDGSPIWLVTRYADVRTALADSRLSVDKAHSRTGYQGFSLPPALDANLLNRDGTDHARLRGLMNQAFTPRRVVALRSRIRAIADDLVAALPPGGQVDLMQTWAAPLPITVICELLGVPGEARPDFRAWTDDLLAPDPDRPGSARRALAALHEFLLDLVAAKRGDPGADLLSALITARDEQDRLTEDELTSMAFMVLFAGYENTVNLLGNGMAALLAHPEQRESLQAEPDRIPAAVDELLRFDPPPQLAIRRFALTDLDIGGAHIPAGDTVMLSLASAHRDPEVFTEPDTLDLTRGCPASIPHLAFGHGRHFCPGASLARLEAEIGISTLLRRFPRLEPAVDVTELAWRPSWRNRGLRSLPVRL